MYPSLIKIRSFIAVAEQLSFRKASEQLNLSQPALSAHVRDLEESFGVTLLHRTTRSVRVTPEGANFLIRSKHALSELEAAVLDLEDQAALRRGRVKIACIPTMAASILPHVIKKFSSQYPAIRIQILDEVADRIYGRILNREADLGIGPAPRGEREIEFTSLLHDHYVAVFPRDHELAGRKNVKVDDLARFPFLVLASPTNVRTALQNAFAERGHVFDPVYEAFSLYTIGGMVEAGLGITALPAITLPTVGHPRLGSARIVKPEVLREVGVLRRGGDTLSPAATEFNRVLMDVIRTMDHGGPVA